MSRPKRRVGKAVSSGCQLARRGRTDVPASVRSGRTQLGGRTRWWPWVGDPTCTSTRSQRRSGLAALALYLGPQRGFCGPELDTTTGELVSTASLLRAMAMAG
eukprot:scaffold79064_cov66-Phaeocystis_antarctica.AAC.1